MLFPSHAALPQKAPPAGCFLQGAGPALPLLWLWGWSDHTGGFRMAKLCPSSRRPKRGGCNTSCPARGNEVLGEEHSILIRKGQRRRSLPLQLHALGAQVDTALGTRTNREPHGLSAATPAPGICQHTHTPRGVSGGSAPSFVPPWQHPLPSSVINELPCSLAPSFPWCEQVS